MSHLKENAPLCVQWEREQIMSPCHADSTTEANGLEGGAHFYTGKMKPISSGEIRSLNQDLPRLLSTILLL